MQPLKLRHYSDSIIHNVDESRFARDNIYKPSGFWVSNDAYPDNWKSWCETEEFQLENLNCVHDVKLKENANILFLNTEIEILHFTEKYHNHSMDAVDAVNLYVSWSKVAEDYQGIVIPNYHWDLRISDKCLWYYSWDCASGCIWDPNAIESITLIEDVKNVSVQK